MKAISEFEIAEEVPLVWLKGFGESKVFRLIDTNGNQGALGDEQN